MNYTLLWQVLGSCAAFLEVMALIDKRDGDTLSEHVWAWFMVTEGGGRAKVRRFLLLTAMVWLTVHFLSGGRIV